MVANRIVMSKLTYLITLWGGAGQYLLNDLQVQQLRAARLVCGFGSFRWSKRQLLSRVGWLSVRQLIFYHSVLQVYKTQLTGVPKPLCSSLSVDYLRMTRSAAAGMIRQQGSTARSTFKCRASKYFNRVPVEVRTGSVAAVKIKLKKWVVSNIPID